MNVVSFIESIIQLNFRGIKKQRRGTLKAGGLRFLRVTNERQ